MKNKEKFPLYDIMTCLSCGSNIIPHFGKEYRYYRCGGYHKKICNSSVIRAEIIEEKIRDIVINNLLLFNFYIEEEKYHLDFDNFHKDRIESLRKDKILYIKLLKNGKLKREEENDLTMLNITLEGCIKWENTSSLVGRKATEKEKLQLINKQKDILMSEDYIKINNFYKKYITIDIHVEEKYGVISFFDTKKISLSEVSYFDEGLQRIVRSTLPLWPEMYKFSL